MYIFQTPAWLNEFSYPFEKYEDIPDDVFEKINRDLDQVQSNEPVVSIMIAAWNEEVNILRCVASLSKMKTTIPFEIIVIDNNSKDRTDATLSRLHVRKLFQEIQGCGPARQLGQENAKGKYILLADADCLYPDCWLNEMMKVLTQPGVVCVYGRYSFISEDRYPRWKLYSLEKMKDIIAEIRHLKRPYLNAYGISMGYVKEYGLKAGYVMYKIWGDDGRLCFDLMAYGKVKQVRSNKARPWTGPRTLDRDGSFGKALKSRIVKELKRFTKMFRQEKPHDTKTSTND
jgi:glycosyltransferase involved in cell wall biosynthesis